MKFLREAIDFQDVKIIVEGTGDNKQLFIEGIFAQAEKKNRNGRIYPQKIMENAVQKYRDTFVNQRRALGELSHPESRPTVKPELASHLITALEMVGPNAMGKAKILNTPQGNVLRGLLEGGVQMGVSTRGLGSIYEQNGITFVKEDFEMMAIDAVSDPSGIDCWVNAINESREWVFIDGRYEEREIEEAKKAIKKASSKDLSESMLQQFTKFMKTIS